MDWGCARIRDISNCSCPVRNTSIRTCSNSRIVRTVRAARTVRTVRTFRTVWTVRTVRRVRTVQHFGQFGQFRPFTPFETTKSLITTNWKFQTANQNASNDLIQWNLVLWGFREPCLRIWCKNSKLKITDANTANKLQKITWFQWNSVRGGFQGR